MIEHTPVPWEVIGRGIYQIDEIGGREVLHGSGIKGRDNKEEVEANARFIVTACNCHADLLEALKKLVNATILGTGAFALTQAEQAIRKAEEQTR